MKKKILLVEDEFFIADLYKRILEKIDLEVDVAWDGKQGLQQAASQPNLILLDILLPKLNGLQVLKELKSNASTKNIPVVLLSNLGQANIIKEAFDLGAQGYLLKVNITPEELVNQVNIFLTNPQFLMDYTKITFD